MQPLGGGKTPEPPLCTPLFPVSLRHYYRRVCVCGQELEALKSELEDSLDTTAAAHDLRSKREQEVLELKRAMDDEARNHESAVQDLRHKYTQQLDEANEQLDQTKKVRATEISADYIKPVPYSSEQFRSNVQWRRYGVDWSEHVHGPPTFARGCFSD